MKARRVVFAVLMTALAIAPADAGTIRGVLWMSSPPRWARSSPAQRARLARAQRGVSDAIVYIQKVPDAVEARLANPMTGLWPFRRPARPGLPTVAQKKLQFAPRVVAVAAGTRMQIENLDGVYHNTFSVSPAKRFDLGLYPPGRVDSVQFRRPGLVYLFCSIHADEIGYVMVTPNHVMVHPDSLGAFRLPKLPPGSYVLRAWHPGKGEFKRKVDVPKHGDVKLDLRF